MSRPSDHGCGRVLWGKVRNLCRVYKLIMVSRVPSYGHLEYLELNIIVDLITFGSISGVSRSRGPKLGVLERW